ncbi:NAD(P)H-dependent oxidoreductase [Undibacterium sp. TS12]|uniref:FMN-dependent NADH-azoreductase n=1 Tax=Undibacterium sp. TS12 TaxID=2908202 RepID=UPI001F4C6FD7|nr:NAD(P)H-dependent oxidoreductase [Undibacterium sp. TS12]MCH8620367.1 NAD(P)H-dependent oxidoreductase [Undibacterium sp. TS12]
MKSLLHIAVSPREGASHSRQAAHQLITGLQERGPVRVIKRDLAVTPLPHPDQAFVTASLCPPARRNQQQEQVLALSDMLINELVLADAVLISTPMHNFALPSVLKAWVDHIVRPHRTFISTAQGKQGLLQDKPVALLLACGGAVADIADVADESGPVVDGMQKDWATPYLRHIFQTMGIRSFQSVLLQNCNRDVSLRQASLDRLRGWQQNWPW